MEKARRFWEIDYLRGVAIVLMVGYHFLFDLKYLGMITGAGYSSFFFFTPRIITSLFLLLVGLSLSLSYTRVRVEGIKRIYLKYLKRGTGLFSLGVMISIVTWYIVPDEYIVFGILHLIGLSIMLAYPFLKEPRMILPVSLIVIALGAYADDIVSGNYWLLFLGIVPAGFQSLDYLPLLPWFGVILVGIHLGNALYPGYKRRIDIPSMPLTGFFVFLGKRSLLIYLLHQPILLLLISLTEVTLMIF